MLRMFQNFVYFVYMSVLFACMPAYQKRHQIMNAMCVLRIEVRTSRRAAGALDALSHLSGPLHGEI